MRFSFIGSMSLHAYHAKCRTLRAIFILHKYFQNFLRLLSFEALIVPPLGTSSNAIQQTLLTHNKPVIVGAHICLSSCRLELRVIPPMISASWGKKICFNTSYFHVPLLEAINSTTHASSWSVDRGEVTLYEEGVGSHLSFQIRMLFPFPIYHRRPFRTTSCATIILLHA